MSPFVEKLGERFAGAVIDDENVIYRELSLFLPCGMPVDIDQDGLLHAITYAITGGLDRTSLYRLVLAREPSVVWQIAMPERRMYDHTREVWIEQKSQRAGYKIAVEFALHRVAPEATSPPYEVAGVTEDGVEVLKPVLPPTSVTQETIAEAVKMVKGSRKGGAK